MSQDQRLGDEGYSAYKEKAQMYNASPLSIEDVMETEEAEHPVNYWGLAVVVGLLALLVIVALIMGGG